MLLLISTLSIKCCTADHKHDVQTKVFLVDRNFFSLGWSVKTHKTLAG